MQSTIQLVTAVAWPVTALLLALIFRKSIQVLTERLSALSVGQVRGEFREALARVEGQIEALPAGREPRGRGDTGKGPNPSAYDQLLRIAEISPRAAVLDAWRDVEVGTRQVTDAYGIASAHGIAGRKAVDDLVKQGLLPHTVRLVYEQLRQLRTRAAHVPEFVVTPAEAIRYIGAANEFSSMLGALLKRASETPCASEARKAARNSAAGGGRA